MAQQNIARSPRNRRITTALIGMVLALVAVGSFATMRAFAQSAHDPAHGHTHGPTSGPASGSASGSALAPENDPGDGAGLVIKDEALIRLADAFPDLDAAAGYTFRARQVVLSPGARTALVSHAGRPSITYVTAGDVQEIRPGMAGPIARKTGDAILARADVTHAFENTGAVPAMLLIVDIVPGK